MGLSPLEERVLSDLGSGNFRFSVHAVARSQGRHISRADVQKAAQDYLDCWVDESEVVHVVGPDWDGSEIEVRAGYDGGTVVITVLGRS